MNAKTDPMNKRQTGFTLVELMITLAVAAILMAIATPSFITMTQNNRMTTQVNDFVSSLNLARSEAIKRGTRITVCKSNDNASCAANNNWDQGWIIFADTDNDAVVDAGEELIRAYAPLAPGNTLTGSGNVDTYISYVGSGFLQQTDGSIQSGELALCDNRGFAASGRAIILGASGQIRTAPGDDGNDTVIAC